MPKIWGFNIENCDIREVFKNRKYPKMLKENVWEFAWDQGKILIHSLLNFKFLKTLSVPQFQY